MSSFRYLLIILVLSTLQAKAQDSLQVVEEHEQITVEETETVDEEVQTMMPLLSSTAVLVDYGKLFGQFLKTEKKYEFGTLVELKNRWVLIGEYGFATLKPSDAYQNTNYESDGQYFRVGLGYKIDMTVKNNLYFSFRYGKAFYSDQGTIDITSASGIYDDLVEPFDRSGLSAQWYEVAMSSEARLWKGLYTGFHLRLRIMDTYDRQEPLDVFTIPGYGRTFDRSIPALNFYLKYAFERF